LLTVAGRKQLVVGGRRLTWFAVLEVKLMTAYILFEDFFGVGLHFVSS
jgi:hypothetical protein